MVPRRFVRLAIVDAVGRVHAHLAPPGLEDQPTRASAQRILDVGPAEDVAKECARCGGIVGINQGVDAGNHQIELLKSPKIVPFRSIANQEAVHRTGDRNKDTTIEWICWSPDDDRDMARTRCPSAASRWAAAPTGFGTDACNKPFGASFRVADDLR